ncbi:MAG: hypothetical protein ACRENE_27815 [Polyangiaceae bacterium]
MLPALHLSDGVQRGLLHVARAVLSAMAHGHEPHAEVIARAALAAVLHLPEDRAVPYSDRIYAALPEATKAALEHLMATGNYEFQSDFAKKHQAKGRTEGRAEGRAQAILDILEARGLAVSEEARARVLGCTDTAQLDLWLRKSATATSVEQVF